MAHEATRPKKKWFRRYAPRRRICTFCADKVVEIDYKDAGRLRRFISDRGRIEPRGKTGTCAKHQRVLSAALKRARHLALLPFAAEHVRQAGSIAPSDAQQSEAQPAAVPKEQ